MNLAFAGTPEFAETILRGLLASEHNVELVVSQPDARRGRGRKLYPPPVAELAEAEGIPLRQPSRIAEVAHEIGACDALIVAAYGQILGPDTLYAAAHDAWNVHASLLPAYRGAAPVERAILNGEAESGVSIIKMDEGLDTGPVALREKTAIAPQMTAGELREILARLGAKAIVEVLHRLEAGTLALEEQDPGGATYASKLGSGDRVIQWNLPARRIKDQVRALAPDIGAQAVHPNFNGPIKILGASIAAGDAEPLDASQAGVISNEENSILVQCGEGVLRIERLQAPGGKPLDSEAFLLGHTLEGAFVVS
ncbi:MAG: methionyl-tRNA formyltransferase [Rubrobacteraceae bacterium]